MGFRLFALRNSFARTKWTTATPMSEHISCADSQSFDENRPGDFRTAQSLALCQMYCGECPTSPTCPEHSSQPPEPALPRRSLCSAVSANQVSGPILDERRICFPQMTASPNCHH